MVKPRTENKDGDKNTPPPPRTTEGEPVRPGSVYGETKEAREKSGETELPPTAGLSGTDYVPYQADTRRVATVGGAGTRPMGGPGETVYTALQNFKTMKYKDPAGYDDIVNQMRQAGIIGPDVRSDVSIAGAYETILKASADLLKDGIVKAPEVLIKEVGDYNRTGTIGAIQGTTGTTTYSGPRTTTSVSVTAKPDVERTLNTFAVDMLGRNLTDEELKKYTAEYREQEMGAPQVTTTTPRGPAATTSVTEQTVSRETIAQNILQDNPMFADNVIKTDVLDMFFNRLGGAAGGS